jgi:hypothetical protein
MGYAEVVGIYPGFSFTWPSNVHCLMAGTLCLMDGLVLIACSSESDNLILGVNVESDSSDEILTSPQRRSIRMRSAGNVSAPDKSPAKRACALNTVDQTIASCHGLCEYKLFGPRIESIDENLGVNLAADRRLQHRHHACYRLCRQLAPGNS